MPSSPSPPLPQQEEEEEEEEEEEGLPSPTTTSLPTILEGVLLKRRDVFTKKWRPRLFVLHIPTSLLVYYLLNEEQQHVQENKKGGRRRPTMKKRFGGGGGKSGGGGNKFGRKRIRQRGPALLSIGGGEDEDVNEMMGGETMLGETNRLFEGEDPSPADKIKYLEFSDSDHYDANQPLLPEEWKDDRIIQTADTANAHSNTSNTDKNPIDYDVVPRGSISLSNRTISPNDTLSTSELYVFTIGPLPKKEKGTTDGGTIYLAASSESERNSWMYYLQLASTCPMVDTVDQSGRCVEEDHCSVSTKEEEEEEIVFQSSSSLFPVEEQQRTAKEMENVDFGEDKLSSLEKDPPQQQQEMDKHKTKEQEDDAAAHDNYNLIHNNNKKNKDFILNPTIHPPPISNDDNEDILTSKLNSIFGSYVHHLLLPTSSTKKEEAEWVDVTQDMLPNNMNNATHTQIQQSVFKEEGEKIRMKISSVFEGIGVLDIFELLVDPGNRTIYDASIQSSIRLKQYNPHTFLDYYSCHAMLPSTKPSDYLVISHWRIISLPSHSCCEDTGTDDDEGDDDKQDETNDNYNDNNKGNRNGIVFFSFSHVNDDICPPIEDHVRGNLIVSMYLLEPISSSSSSQRGCKMTRILCMELNDNNGNNNNNSMEKVPSAISVGKVVMQKQSVLPFSISDYFINEGGGGGGDPKEGKAKQLRDNDDELINQIRDEFIMFNIISKLSQEDSEDVVSEDGKSTEEVSALEEEEDDKEEQQEDDTEVGTKSSGTDDVPSSSVDSASSDSNTSEHSPTQNNIPTSASDVERSHLVADRSARGLIENYTDTVAATAVKVPTDADSEQTNAGRWATTSISSFAKRIHDSSSGMSKRQKTAFIAIPFVAYLIYIMTSGGGTDVIVGLGYNLFQKPIKLMVEFLMSLLSTSNIIYFGESLVTMVFLILFIAVALKSGVDRLNENSSTSSPNNTKNQKKNKKEKQSRSVKVDVKSTTSRGSGGSLNRSSFMITVFHALICSLVPIISWKLEQRYQIPLSWKGLVSALSTMFAIRAVVTRQLGSALTHTDDGMPFSSSVSRTGVGTVTCRFKVNLKGILRFIANKKEEREEQVQLDNVSISASSSLKSRSNVEVSVTHIVVKAVAVAMADLPVLNSHHIYYLPLLINGFYASDTIDISVGSGASSQRSNNIVTLRDVGCMSIQQIAEKVARRKHHHRNDTNVAESMWSVFSMIGRNHMSWMPLSGKRYKSQFGSCIVFTSPDSENSEVDIEVAPAPYAGGANIAVVVGGVRRAPPRSSSSSPRHPFLSVAITIDCPAASVGTCRKFVEHVQKLLQFPEVYEEAQLKT